jgi:Sulfotransferase domain
MLILCYGITKSGSTLTFELIKGMLHSIGQEQYRLPSELVTARHKINFLESVNKGTIKRLVAAIPNDRMIAVKTHQSINPATFLLLEELQAERKVQVVASYRDPRDICLSLLDAGNSARARGTKPFSEYTDLASTVLPVQRQLLRFQKWASIRGALRLDYELVAFSPDRAIDAIEHAIGIQCDHSQAKRHAFDDAFTQKNKAVMRRHAEELTEQQAQELLRAFGKFIQHVCTKNDDRWLAAFRERFLANAAASRA